MAGATGRNYLGMKEKQFKEYKYMCYIACTLITIGDLDLDVIIGSKDSKTNDKFIFVKMYFIREASNESIT